MIRPVLIVGSTGQVGTAFRRLLPEARHVSRPEVDLRDHEALVKMLGAIDPELIINCAAFTAVDAAEDDEATARSVNAIAPGLMAEWCAAHNSRLVTFSTDYVFDGSKSSPWVESDSTCPINAYGRSKAEGETLVLAGSDDALVVRTSWVISATHRNFVATMVDLAQKGPLKVVNDQHGCPTVADDLAEATIAALHQEAVGLLHITNRGATTWFGLARESLRLCDLDPSLVEPCSTEEFPRPAPRPRNSVLDSDRLVGFGVEVRDWQSALADMVSHATWR